MPLRVLRAVLSLWHGHQCQSVSISVNQSQSVSISVNQAEERTEMVELLVEIAVATAHVAIVLHEQVVTPMGGGGDPTLFDHDVLAYHGALLAAMVRHFALQLRHHGRRRSD